jgi:monothiol glutaredoxin
MSAIETETLERIKRQIAGNIVLLYMKGSPDFPMCGFSGRVIQILDALKTKYAYVNILENPDIRATLPVYAKWPTFPQLYIQGELIGGCDIVSELHQKGELKSLLENAQSLMNAKPEAALATE